MTQSTAKPLLLLTKKRDWAYRRAETVGRALERLEGTKEWHNAYKRWQLYLQTVANLTLAIDQLRQMEGKEVRALGA